MSRVLVSVGTDFHPFQRLVDWADAFALRHPEHEVFIQYGSARPPVHGDRSQLLDHSQLQTEIGRADVVVCHGGPATITEVRRSGLTPVCVPRDPQFGEHVDEHQLRFVRHLANAGLVRPCSDLSSLDAIVGDALAEGRRPPEAAQQLAPGVQRLGELMADLTASRATAPVNTVTTDKVTVIYIGGQGRSGTTLLERALGEIEGIASVGELVHLWERGLRDDDLCGCGEPFSRCVFWSSVGNTAFGGWGRLDADEAVHLRFSVDRNRFLPLLAKPGLLAAYRGQHDRYARRLSQLYRAIAQISGARIIVDSSKHASYAMMLSSVPDIDLRVLHVVRDSRAVAHAWAKSVPRPEAGGDPMPVYGPTKAAVLWNVQNAVIENMKRRHPYLRLSYEQFVDSPKDVLIEAARFADVVDDTEVLRILDDGTLHLSPSHTVAGNPMRFLSGDIAIRSDQSWRTAMPTARKRLVSALTLPLQRRYGYEK